MDATATFVATMTTPEGPLTKRAAVLLLGPFDGANELHAIPTRGER